MEWRMRNKLGLSLVFGRCICVPVAPAAIGVWAVEATGELLTEPTTQKGATLIILGSPRQTARRGNPTLFPAPGMDRQSEDLSLHRPNVSRSQPPSAIGAPLRGPGTGDERRSLALSYGLWCLSLVGICGIHRVYNRKPLTGFLWLFTFGLCGIGQLVDLFLIPGMVEGVNRQLNLPAGSVGAATPIDRQLLRLARQAGEKGFTINDALIELDLPLHFDSGSLQEEIDKLMKLHLLDVGNDERGRVIYREP